MLYDLYQAQADALTAMRVFADVAARGWGQLEHMFPGHPGLRGVTAGYEFVSRAGLTHERPAFGIDTITLGGSRGSTGSGGSTSARSATRSRAREVGVVEEPVLVTPFASLVHFRKEVDVTQPRVLVLAPLSGHFASLLRSTVRTLLPEHDVFISDWHNARDIPLAEGQFGFDDYTDTVIRFVEAVGEGTHMIAVCQPVVSALAATAVMAEADNPATPSSLTLMAGPVDTRINPTSVNHLATSMPLEWFERQVITSVPLRYRGRFRRVYPGFLQLAGFLGMNPMRHFEAHANLYSNLVIGDDVAADATTDFYDEYFAVLDMTAEFYLETVQRVFQEHQLARGTLEHRGRRVDPSAIRRTGLVTVEGERDDICGIGQTRAAQDLCTNVPAREHHMQPGVGHYGVFSGKKWERQVYPMIRRMILSTSA